MIAIISPAKTLDENSEIPELDFSQPHFLSDSERVMSFLKKKSKGKLQKMMSISPDLAELNYERNQVWNQNIDSDLSRPAVRMFKGDVYLGMEAWNWDEADYNHAQDHLLILSGLYGLLRPLDKIQPYRLEMGTDLKVASYKNLYQFWKKRLVEKINNTLEESNENHLVNLASKEYFSAIDTSKLRGEVITINFKEYRNGKYTFMSFFGKKARGYMADFIIRNRFTQPEELKAFGREGYAFNPDISSEREWIFTRES